MVIDRRGLGGSSGDIFLGITVMVSRVMDPPAVGEQLGARAGPARLAPWAYC